MVSHILTFEVLAKTHNKRGGGHINKKGTKAGLQFTILEGDIPIKKPYPLDSSPKPEILIMAIQRDFICKSAIYKRWFIDSFHQSNIKNDNLFRDFNTMLHSSNKPFHVKMHLKISLT